MEKFESVFTDLDTHTEVIINVIFPHTNMYTYIHAPFLIHIPFYMHIPSTHIHAPFLIHIPLYMHIPSTHIHAPFLIHIPFYMHIPSTHIHLLFLIRTHTHTHTYICNNLTYMYITGNGEHYVICYNTLYSRKPGR